MESGPTNFAKKDPDPLINFLHKIILYCVKALSILMIIVIVWSLIDVIVVLYEMLVKNRTGLSHLNELLTVMGAFIAVLIAIEIFSNIVFYLKEDTLHTKLVLATALMAISRKVIILDYSTTPPEYVYATGAVVLAVAIAYWLVSQKREVKEL
jgi:uncharacterized membrane protein (DUF373 family)